MCIYTLSMDVSSPQSCETRSRLSVAESMAEYFDATEVLVSESLSENEASDESGLSDVTTSNSEPEEANGTSLINALIYQTGSNLSLIHGSQGGVFN